MKLEVKDPNLTHTIPLMVVSDQPLNFIKLRNKTRNNGKHYVNEFNDVKPVVTQAGVLVMYTWYGEQLCTKKEFEAWELDQKVKNKIIDPGKA